MTTTPKMSCPSGGQFYACGDGSRFVGCCQSNPCGSTRCAAGNLKSASFDPASWGQIPDQQCDAGLFYTCSATDPPFWGCCQSNPCSSGSGCTANDLAGAFLSANPSDAQVFLSLNSTWEAAQGTSSAAATSATETTSSTSSASSATGSLSSSSSPFPPATTHPPSTNIAGPVAGGVVGGAAVIVALILGILFIRRRRAPSRTQSQVGNDSQQRRPETTTVESNPTSETSNINSFTAKMLTFLRRRAKADGLTSATLFACTSQLSRRST